MSDVVDYGSQEIEFSTPPGLIGRALSEADHRIANHLAMLSAYVTLKTAEFERAAPTRDDLRVFLQGLNGQICGISRLHRLLMSRPNADVELADVLREVCSPFAGPMAGRVVIIEDFAVGCVVAPDQILSISQIVTECVTNSAKHAYPGNRRGVVLVRCRRPATGRVVVEIRDTGIGLPAQVDPRSDPGFGFRLMRALSDGLRATLQFDSHSTGLLVRLSLPLSYH